MGEKQERVLTINGIELSEIVGLDDEDVSISGTRGIEPLMKTTWTIRLKKMSRKKFVKQLMALGAGRNEAVARADEARLGGWEYASAFLGYVLMGKD